jgi:selenocysteine-specific elongation factor
MQAASSLFDNGSLLELNGTKLVITNEALDGLEEKSLTALAAYHQQVPLRAGMPREQLKSQLGITSEIFDALIKRLAAAGALHEAGAKLNLKGHTVVFSEPQKKQVEELLTQFTAQPYAPPTRKQCLESMDESLLNALLETDQLVQVNEEVLLLPETYQAMREAVIEQIKAQGQITLAELRDTFQTSRKYAVAVLEHLDQAGITLRRGDVRVLRRP